jgi:TPR repeat protein
MNAPLERALAALLFACCLNAHAQDKINTEDLKVRSAAGDRAATRQLAEMYYVGRGGVEQDFKEAAAWYGKLAKQGDARAQTSLGLMYARGYGVEKNMDTARRWWSFAAAQNDPGAQYNLGTLYFRGEDVARDYVQAARWYRNAAQRGHVQAQTKLGSMFYEGQGLDKSMHWAYYWLKIAALQGDDDAQTAIRLVAKNMSAESVRDADIQVNEWMKKYKQIVGK